MDLPGLREVQLWATAERLEDSFDDIQKLAQSCRFRDCAHMGEPGCAVGAAGLEPARLANYLKMQQELANLEKKTGPRPSPGAKSGSKAPVKSGRPAPRPDRIK